ncbi:hypothetical protein THOM_0329 [Trachipleistophora hominis]|uniref:Lipoprotein n=1 Tax=Trachipleistophora hominis TaxID=72359 RepID=L7JYS3_TRAHO|nr:hypothetical protein THOM_0329 [Trachipleistophora hominis]
MLRIVLCINLLLITVCGCTVSQSSNEEKNDMSKQLINWFFKEKLLSMLGTGLKTANVEANSVLTRIKPDESLLSEAVEQYSKNKNKKNLLGNPIFDDNGNLIILNSNGKDKSSLKDHDSENIRKTTVTNDSAYVKRTPDGENIVEFERQAKLSSNPNIRKQHYKNYELCTDSVPTCREKRIVRIYRNDERKHLENYSSSSDGGSIDFDSSHYADIKHHDAPVKKRTYSSPHSMIYTINEYYKSKPYQRKVREISMYQIPGNQINPLIPISRLERHNIVS